MSNCGKISANILVNCDSPLVGGVKDRLILMNLEDIDSVTRNVTNTQIIEGITLITSSPATVAYEVEGKNSSIDSRSALVKSRYSEGFSHELVFRIFDKSPEVKEQIEAMAKGKFVAILENNYKGTLNKAAFEIKGLDIGLELLEMTEDNSDAETEGAYVLTLKTPEGFKEPHLPATFFLTDYATTKALVEGLLV